MLGGLAIVVVAALLVCLGFLAADRWMIHDDTTAMLGEWYVPGSSASVVINDRTIKLNAETAYEYEVDETAKTISYQFGELKGQGHYWFSQDRRTLIIADGKDFTAWGTALEDWLRMARDLFDDTFNGGAKVPSGDNIIMLTRTQPTASAVDAAGAVDATDPADAASATPEAADAATGTTPEAADAEDADATSGPAAAADETQEKR